MKILLAPAENKQEGGSQAPIKTNELYPFQNKILDLYEQHIQNSSIEELSSWFGIKNLYLCEKYNNSIKDLPTLKAIQRYTGVVFEALSYSTLNKKEQEFIDKHVYIYSNLFGILKANSLIPNYKFKQGAILPTLHNEKFYKEYLKDILDKTLGNEVLDLSASYYTKYYKPIAKTITYKFLKNKKVVSHWAKYYRGELLRQIALNNIQDFNQLLNHKFEGLNLIEIQEKKNIKTIIMEIV